MFCVLILSLQPAGFAVIIRDASPIFDSRFWILGLRGRRHRTNRGAAHPQKLQNLKSKFQNRLREETMKIRYLPVSILFSAGLVAGMLLLFVHLVGAAPTALAASTVPAGGAIPMQTVLTPTKDNTIYDTSPPSSNGAGMHLFVGATDSGSSRRALLAFDIAGGIPPSSTILSVTLQMNVSNIPSNANPNSVSLHAVSADWGEGTSNAGSPGGNGTTPSIGDATWQHTFFNTQLWQNLGGDFEAAASATITVTGLGLYHWGSTAEMVNDVQGWLDDPSSNFGWILVGSEGANRTARRFDARENNTTARRPQLTVVFTTPGQAFQTLYLPLIQTP
jgi:hypothetical protein